MRAAAGSAPRKSRSGRSSARRLALPKDGRFATEVQRAVDRLYLFPGAPAPRAAVFASVDDDTQGGWVSAHIGDLLAASVPGSVCLVDANLRAPALHEWFGVANGLGLTDVATDPGLEIKSAATRVPGGELWLLTAGTPLATGSTAVYTKTLGDRMSDLRRAFEYVVLHAPPIGVYRDAIALGQAADAVVLILRARSTPRDVACRARDEFAEAGVTVAGAILIDSEAR